MKKITRMRGRGSFLGCSGYDNGPSGLVVLHFFVLVLVLGLVLRKYYFCWGFARGVEELFNASQVLHMHRG